MRRTNRFPLLLMALLLGTGGHVFGGSITCPGGAGAYPQCPGFAVTITVSNTGQRCVEQGTGDPPQVKINCKGLGEECVKIEFTVKRISDGHVCKQDVTVCDQFRGPVRIRCFNKTFEATVNGPWGDVVGNGDCNVITGVNCN